MRLSEFLLLQRNVALTPPGVVVRLICFQSLIVAFFAVFIVFIGNELVAAERVGVGKILVELDCSAKEFERCLMFFQKTVAISDYAPGLWGKQ